MNRPALGLTLLFTHGWSLNRTSWGYARAALSHRFRVVTWDLPGLGRSQAPPRAELSLEQMAEDLAAVLDQVAPTGSVVLVGHSIGGMIQQTLARRFPHLLGNLVAGIVLIDTTYTNPLSTAWGGALWLRLQKPLIEPLNHLLVWLSPVAWLSNIQSYQRKFAPDHALHQFRRMSNQGPA